MISVKDLSKHYGDAVSLENVHLEIPQGSATALLGEEGSGKSTLLRLLCRLEDPTKGLIMIGGVDVSRVPPQEHRASVGYVVRGAGLVPSLTVRQNAGLPPRLGKFSPSQREEEIQRTLERVGIDGDMAESYPARLSTLDRFKAALARALAGGPTVVLMDEPFWGFDRESRDFMRREFLRIRSLYSAVTFVIATREVVEAVKLATHICVMRGGKALEMASKKDFIESPRTKYGSDMVRRHRFQIQLEAVSLREMMIQDPVFITTAQSNLPLSRAVFLMRKHRIGSLLVTDENRVLKGLIGLDETAENQERRIGDLIRHDISWLRTTDSFSDALRFFVEEEDEFLPITDESNRLQGLITRKGVSKYLEKLI